MGNQNNQNQKPGQQPGRDNQQPNRDNQRPGQGQPGKPGQNDQNRR